MSTPIDFKDNVTFYGVPVHLLSDAEASTFECRWIGSGLKAPAISAITLEKSKVDPLEAEEKAVLGIEVSEVQFSEFDRRKTARNLSKHLAFDAKGD